MMTLLLLAFVLLKLGLYIFRILVFLTKNYYFIHTFRSLFYFMYLWIHLFLKHLLSLCLGIKLFTRRNINLNVYSFILFYIYVAGRFSFLFNSSHMPFWLI